MEISRRHFLNSSAAVLAAGVMAHGRVWGANEKIGVCVVGVNGRGKSHIEGFTESPDSEVVALCDVDAAVLERVAGEFEKKNGRKPKLYRDMREAFADPEVDVVSIATPNH
ncbi:MAG TPA: Gfo/Idh/MocA family oxidoreductase, partial [Candidatus Hydrogenedentes bacterium]|nr:Gfo/Idh/MocA family oxidoreductase [Candidatus Hydrogenedentota bacterium]